jgi:hypothetical protein
VRNGDVVFDRHGYGLATLLWAIEQAAGGQTACFVVVSAEDGRRHDRDVCLEGLFPAFNAIDQCSDPLVTTAY